MLVTWIDLIVPASHFLLSKRDVHIFPIHIIDDATSDPADSAPGVQSLRLNGGSFFQSQQTKSFVGVSWQVELMTYSPW